MFFIQSRDLCFPFRAVRLGFKLGQIGIDWDKICASSVFTYRLGVLDRDRFIYLLIKREKSTHWLIAFILFVDVESFETHI